MGDDERVTRTELADPRVQEEAAAFFHALGQAKEVGLKAAQIAYGGAEFLLQVPPVGEGDRGVVYRLPQHSLSLPEARGPLCLKVAKPQPICRQRLLEERMTTDFFLSQGVRVPVIHHLDEKGRFAVKDFIDGESVTSLYMRFDQLSVPTQQLLLEGIRAFLETLLELFRKRPDCKVSISPNNIYVLRERGKFKDPPDLVLIDPGTTLKKNYDGFDFPTYWNKVLPERIKKYQRTGYLQWLVPQEVTQSERDEAGDFEVFRNLKPSEVFLLLKAGKTVEFDPEEVILREGEVGETFYLVLEGEVEARRGPIANPSWTLRIGKGSVLGEMAFLLHVPRSMTIVAATPAKLIQIDKEPFNELLAANLTAPYKLIYNIAISLAERLHQLDASHHKLLEAQRLAGNGG